VAHPELVLYFAPRTRAIRVRWLLEELELPYRLERVTFKPTTDRFFIQDTPTGKLPTLVDGDVVMAESGAIVEYLLERYGNGRLAPPAGSAERAAYLQWLHFAESTAFPPLGIVIWLTRYRDDSSQHQHLLADARQRVVATFEQIERALAGNQYLVGDTFSAADIMMGFTVGAAQLTGLLGDGFPELQRYMARLQARPALQRSTD
jgi:glutathione S-transferase